MTHLAQLSINTEFIRSQQSESSSRRQRRICLIRFATSATTSSKSWLVVCRTSIRRPSISPMSSPGLKAWGRRRSSRKLRVPLIAFQSLTRKVWQWARRLCIWSHGMMLRLLRKSSHLLRLVNTSTSWMRLWAWSQIVVLRATRIKLLANSWKNYTIKCNGTRTVQVRAVKATCQRETIQLSTAMLPLLRSRV